MAGDGGNPNDSITNNAVINGLEDNVLNILHQMGSKTDNEILTDLAGLEMSDLIDAREYLFKSSLDIVRQRIIDQGIPVGQINIILRKRIINKTLADDILKLVYYVLGKEPIFPRDVLSMNAQYVDLNISSNTSDGIIDSEDNKAENVKYNKLLDCISDLTNKFDSLDISHKQLQLEHSNLARAHSFEIQQLRGYLTDAKSKPSKTLDSNHHAATLTPGQQLHETQTNGSSQGSNLGQRPGEGETGTKNGSDLGSVRGPGVVSDSVTGHSTSTPNNEQSHSKPVHKAHKRDPNKRLIDSSTSPALVKINDIGTDSGDNSNVYDTDDSDDTPFTVVKRDRRRSMPKDALISGIKRETGVKVYVQNIHRKQGQPLREIANNVRKYCTSKNVRSMNAFAIRNKVVDDIVGCQLTIPMRFYDTVIADRFWPSEVVCKKWEDKTTTDQSRDPSDKPKDSGIISGRSRSQDRRSSGRGRTWSDRTRSNSRSSRSSSWNRKPRL